MGFLLRNDIDNEFATEDPQCLIVVRQQSRDDLERLLTRSRQPVMQSHRMARVLYRHLCS